MKNKKLNIVFPEGFNIPNDCEIIIDKFHIKDNKFSKLEVDDEDLIGSYTWNEANKQIKLLNSLNYKGFNNWRLPTKEELNFLYENKDIVGGFSSSPYWSSTKYSHRYTWGQYFVNGYQFGNLKNYNLRVRCVRDK